ncbi:TPA: UDP-N-acetylmuramoyl-tripeptide--D-alanyl-D-alanine ligase, partial [Neisseria meningitidis]
MKPLDLNFICQALKLPMPSESKPVSRIVTDSRDIRAGDVFFALAGGRFDAHDFVEDVL